MPIFETVDELRSSLAPSLETYSAKTPNLNGILDPNENDADVSVPADNRDGMKLDPGLCRVHSTVYTRSLDRHEREQPD